MLKSLSNYTLARASVELRVLLSMGEMTTVKIMRQLVNEWALPDEMKVSWDANNNQEVTHAEKIFSQYLAEGWIAYSDEPKGRKQIFKFDPKLTKIILMPPLAGG